MPILRITGSSRTGVNYCEADRRAPTRTLHRRSGSASGAAREGLPLVSFLAHLRFLNPSTRTHVRLLGPCSRRVGWGARRPLQRSAPRGAPEARGYRPRRRRLPGAPRAPGLWPPARATTVHAPSRSADQQEPFRIRPVRVASPHPLPSRQFQALFLAVLPWARSLFRYSGLSRAGGECFAQDGDLADLECVQFNASAGCLWFKYVKEFQAYGFAA